MTSDQKYLDELRDYNPTVPFLWRNKEVILLIPDDSKQAIHQFGGASSGQAQELGVQRLLTLNPQGGELASWLPSGKTFPLYFAFQYDAVELEYAMREGEGFDLNLEGMEPTDGWPYEGFPAALPALKLRESAKYELDDEVIMTLLNNEEVAEIEDYTIAVVPSKDAESVYGASLWGEMGDGGVQCIIHIREDGSIFAHNASS